MSSELPMMRDRRKRDPGAPRVNGISLYNRVFFVPIFRFRVQV